MITYPNPGAWVWPAAMIVWGPGFTSARHSHHCVQLVMVTQGTLRIRSGPGAAWKICGAALVRPDADHEVDARGKTLLIGFIDPESELGTALAERIQGDISRLAAADVKHWRIALGSKLTQQRVERWVRKDLLSGRRVVRIHPRVRRVLKYLRDNLGRVRIFHSRPWPMSLVFRHRGLCTCSQGRSEFRYVPLSFGSASSGHPMSS